MTPSEIADECLTLSRLEAGWYADVGKRTGERCCEAMRNAAATIRAQAEALKIATEALEYVGKYSPGPNPATVWSGSAHTRVIAAQALARIGEVG